MSPPSLTIALPVLNGGNHLRECVASILGQSVSDFDLVVLDNCSTDGSLEWLRDLGDPRITIIPAEEPLTIEENWSRVLTIKKNEFITTIGHDDLLDRSFFEVVQQLIHRHPEAGLYLTHFRLIDEQGDFRRHCLPMPEKETAANFLASRLCDIRLSFGTGHVMRSADYERIGGIPSYRRLLFADDALFLQAIGSSYRATAFEETFSYRWHSQSAAGGAAMQDFFLALEQYSGLLSQRAIADTAIAEVLQRYFGEYALTVGKLYYQETLAEASRARSKPDESIRARINTLASRFGPMPEWKDNMATRLLEKAQSSPAHRLAYRAWVMQRKARQATQRLGHRLLFGNESPASRKNI